MVHSNTKIIIKKLTPRYAKEVRALFLTVIYKDFPPYPKKVRNLFAKRLYTEKYFRKIARSKGGVIFGSFAKNKLIGYIIGLNHTGGMIIADWLVVHEDHREKGIGSKLLSALEKWSIEDKNHCLYLYTESEKTVEYYKKRGFHYVGFMKNSWYGLDLHILQKILRNKPFDEMFERYAKKK